MKTEQKMILAAAIACSAALISLALNGCSGDDDSNCMATTGCPDAGSATVDANPLAPDADTTPDANPDVCADYRWMAEKPWDCQTSVPYTCDMELLPADGVCGVQCHDHFWLGTDELIITKEPPPSRLIYYIVDEPITCYQHL